jgi:hypothetical protein
MRNLIEKIGPEQQFSLLRASSTRRQCLSVRRLHKAFKHAPGTPGANSHDGAFGYTGPAPVAGSGAEQIMK